MNSLLQFIKNEKVFKDIYKEAEKDNSTLITGITKNITFFTLMHLFKETNKNIIVVCNSLYNAQKLYDIFVSSNNSSSVSFFPQDEFVTSEMLAVSKDFKIERLNTIKDLVDGVPQIIITNIAGLLRPEMPLFKWDEAVISIKDNKEYDLKELVNKLVNHGYTKVPTVEAIGQFSVRGGLVDIFPLNTDNPYRIEFFGDEVESIREFDVTTQRSITRTSSFDIYPMFEFFYNQNELNSLLEEYKKRKSSIILDEKSSERVEQDIVNLMSHNNLDRLHHYISFIHKEKHTIIDYANNPIITFIDYDKVIENYDHVLFDIADWYDNKTAYQRLGFDFIIDFNKIQMNNIYYFESLKNDVKPKVDETIKLTTRDSINYNGNINLLVKDILKNKDFTYIINFESTKSRSNFIESIESQLKYILIGSKDEIRKNKLNLTIGPYIPGFTFFDEKLVVISEDLIYRKSATKKVRYGSVVKNHKKLKNVDELNKGDYIVHSDNGIGRFLGLTSMKIGKVTNDYLHIAYKGEDTLYVPVENINLLYKFSSREGVKPKLNKLGGSNWKKTKSRVKGKIKDIADKLLKLYADREKAVGFQYQEDTTLQIEFESEFPYEETPDQLKSINEIKDDMESTRPMDRLLCGDVGYGKTEVAIRAAFKAIMDNKQVAYLAPTTVLSRQHYNTFNDRLSKYGINVELMNRFVTPKKQHSVIEELNRGTVDCLIGTHRILSKDVKYKDLGLLIIDEEQRFGVEHKEKIKEMKVNIDVLSLSATPIPRTLQMALIGVKSMSLLETPPKNRYPIQTYVLERHETIIKDAIERELMRNGQVFYLYNKVEDIEQVAASISRACPDAKVVFAHGRMQKSKLESVIDSFYNNEFNVLVSTTIIETGIDIPNANTLLIHDADTLGLSQIYQIRGRVGRSDRIAYAYLMYRKNKILTELAEKRLRVIRDFTELGSGYKIALRDLSIRGAGDVLGSEQSGFMDSIGIDLYMDLLDEELENRKSNIKDIKPEKENTTINKRINISKHIPEKYINDDYTKIEMHKKINKVHSIKDYNNLINEFTDRFGKISEEIKLYMMEQLFLNIIDEKGVERFIENDDMITIVFDENVSTKYNVDDLFYEAYQISNKINFKIKLGKINIYIVLKEIKKHWLYPITELLLKMGIKT